MDGKLYDIPDLREKVGVFRDRIHAGRVLAGMLTAWKGSNAMVLAIPSGGVPVAVEIARLLDLSLDVALVSKILLPWTTEAGFGAVAFDGSVWINPEYAAYYQLDQKTIDRQTRAASEKVRHRLKLFRKDRPWPGLKERPALVVDDGIAAGSTLRVAITALMNSGAGRIVVVVPTAHREALAPLMGRVEAVYCPNIRSGPQFAVASAYQYWDDVDENQAAELLRTFRERKES